MPTIQYRYKPTPPDPYDSSAEWHARNQERNSSYDAGAAKQEQQTKVPTLPDVPQEPTRYNQATGERIAGTAAPAGPRFNQLTGERMPGSPPPTQTQVPVLPDIERFGVMRRSGINPATGQEYGFVGVGAPGQGNRTLPSYEEARAFSQGTQAKAGTSLPYLPPAASEQRGFSQDGQRDVQWMRNSARAAPAPAPAAAGSPAQSPAASLRPGAPATPPAASAAVSPLAPALSIKGAGQRLGQGLTEAATNQGAENPFNFMDTAERYGTAATGALWDGSWNVPEKGLIRQGVEAAADNPLVRNIGSAIGNAQAQARTRDATAAGRIAPDFSARAAAAQQKYFPQLPDIPAPRPIGMPNINGVPFARPTPAPTPVNSTSRSMGPHQRGKLVLPDPNARVEAPKPYTPFTLPDLDDGMLPPDMPHLQRIGSTRTSAQLAPP